MNREELAAKVIAGARMPRCSCGGELEDTSEEHEVVVLDGDRFNDSVPRRRCRTCGETFFEMRALEGVDGRIAERLIDKSGLGNEARAWLKKHLHGLQMLLDELTLREQARFDASRSSEAAAHAALAGTPRDVPTTGQTDDVAPCCESGCVDKPTFICHCASCSGVAPGERYHVCSDSGHLLHVALAHKSTMGRAAMWEPIRPIEMRCWGADHWSALEYIGRRITDHDGAPNPINLRTDPLAHPALVQQMPFGGRQLHHPTVLQDGTIVYGHDDWSCLSDAEAAGLLVNTGTSVERVYKLTERGQEVMIQLLQSSVRDHKFRNFTPK
jgi:hypothetical protein